MKLRSQFPSTSISIYRRKVNETTVSNYINLIHILTVILCGLIVAQKKGIFTRSSNHTRTKSSCARGRNLLLLYFLLLLCFRQKLSYIYIECESDPLLRIPRSFNGTLLYCLFFFADISVIH